MAKVKVKHSSAGFIAVLKSSEVKAELEETTKRIAEAARADAPEESGEYKESIDSTVEMGSDRWVGYVYADAEHSMVVEARTGNLMKAAKDGGS